MKVEPRWTLQLGSFFKLEGFKANESGLLFELVNLISEMDEFCGTSEIKNLISKTNEYLFEITENHLINILKELKRLKSNTSDLSKDEIIKWINDIILFYSDKV